MGFCCCFLALKAVFVNHEESVVRKGEFGGVVGRVAQALKTRKRNHFLGLCDTRLLFEVTFLALAQTQLLSQLLHFLVSLVQSSAKKEDISFDTFVLFLLIRLSGRHLRVSLSPRVTLSSAIYSPFLESPLYYSIPKR